jgi:alcohol dehydrogenase
MHGPECRETGLGCLSAASQSFRTIRAVQRGLTSSALVLEAPHRLERRELPRPRVGDDDALLRVEACGLCGTDHEQWSGALFPGYAFVPGHESVGVIERIGPEASRRWGVREGDRVAVEVFLSCGECAECRDGTYRRCVRHGLGDMYGFVPVTKPPALWGGYAQHQYLAPHSMLLRVPPSLDPVTATMFNPLGAGIRWGVTLPGTRPGDVVAVLGPGVRGLSVCAAAKHAGAAFVLVTGRGERDATRLAIAPDFGADVAVDVATDDPVAALRAAAGRLADVVVDVTAKAPAALGQAIRLARPGGTIVLAGTRGHDVEHLPGFDPDLIVYKELRVLGALGVDVAAYRAAFELLDARRFSFADLPRRIVGFDGAAALLADMAGEHPQPGAPEPPVHGVIVPDPIDESGRHQEPAQEGPR